MTDTIKIVLATGRLSELAIIAIISFLLSMLLTPLYTTIAYKYEWWKKLRSADITGKPATMLQKLHGEKHKRNIPTMAGLITVVAVSVTTLLFNWSKLTYLPVVAMVGAGSVGLLDDYINLRGNGKGIAGLRSKIKLFLMIGVSLLGGLYFYFKLDQRSVHVPFIGNWAVGLAIIPLFVLVVVATANAVNMTDGLDGLAGGLLVVAFLAYAVIAFLQEKYGLAGFCLSMVGGLLSYVWFNIFPARFFMGDVGSFAFGTALGVVAMLTDTLFLLPVIGLVFVVEASSTIIQLTSKKLRNGKKVFKIAPIHHHFEAIGWPEAKVTMRFWVIGQVAAIVGVFLFISGGPL
jgi:phospho-N-acetylmuramoyl-pentapeptide-transferase